jgi:hypothetical protein
VLEEEFLRRYKSLFPGTVTINPPLDTVQQVMDVPSATHLHQHGWTILSPHQDQYKILYSKEATPKQVLQGYFHLSARRLNLGETRKQLDTDFENVYAQLQSNGWNVADLFVGDEHRIQVGTK